MTNANLAKMVKAANGQELTLEYKGGTQKILVPEGIPVVTAVPLTARCCNLVSMSLSAFGLVADGSMTAARVQASKGWHKASDVAS